MTKICIIVGTRPEIIKMSPIIRECLRLDYNYSIIHTGQHYSYNMDKIFFNQLNLPKPKYNLDVGSGTHAEQIGKILVKLEKVLLKEKPDIILVQGDTNTVLSSALVANRLQIQIGHVEAGLRSYDQKMPEENNRILTDHCSDYLFSPTEKSKKTLLSEGISENKIFVTGNTIVDSVYQNLELANKKNNVLEKLELERKQFFLATIHRQENVDDKKRFQDILKGLQIIYNLYQIPIIYPIHPRSYKKLKEFGLKPKNINLIDPINFLDFLQLENNSKLILTDSGGVQEESCILGSPCVTLRDNTERQETIDIGSNILSGTKSSSIADCVSYMLNKSNDWINPFGDGNSGRKIIEIIGDKI